MAKRMKRATKRKPVASEEVDYYVFRGSPKAMAAQAERNRLRRMEREDEGLKFVREMYWSRTGRRYPSDPASQHQIKRWLKRHDDYAYPVVDLMCKRMEKESAARRAADEKQVKRDRKKSLADLAKWRQDRERLEQQQQAAQPREPSNMKESKKVLSPAKQREVMMEAIERAKEEQALANMKALAVADAPTEEEQKAWQYWKDVELPAYKKALAALEEEITEREFRQRYPGLAALKAEHGKKLVNTLAKVVAETRKKITYRGVQWDRWIDWLDEIDVQRALRKRPLKKRKQVRKRRR